MQINKIIQNFAEFIEVIQEIRTLLHINKFSCHADKLFEMKSPCVLFLVCLYSK